MTKQQAFIEWVESLIRNQEEPITPTNEALSYWEALQSADTPVEKPDFTDNGKAILKYLQDVPAQAYKARDIAEGMFIASKSVSGAMRKLVTDGYVEKIGQNPVVYMITEKGKNVVFENEGENE